MFIISSIILSRYKNKVESPHENVSAAFYSFFSTLLYTITYTYSSIYELMSFILVKNIKALIFTNFNFFNLEEFENKKKTEAKKKMLCSEFFFVIIGLMDFFVCYLLIYILFFTSLLLRVLNFIIRFFLVYYITLCTCFHYYKVSLYWFGRSHKLNLFELFTYVVSIRCSFSTME